MILANYKLVCLYASCIMIFGCAADVEPPPPVPQVRPESRFKVILDHQTMQIDGEPWTVSFSDISDIVIHSETEAADDGFKTALISFQSKHGDQAIKAKVRIKYKDETARLKGGGEISTFPVDELTTLSVEKVGDW